MKAQGKPDYKNNIVLEPPVGDHINKKRDKSVKRKKVRREHYQKIGFIDGYIPARAGYIHGLDYPAEDHRPEGMGELMGHDMHKDRFVQKKMQYEVSNEPGEKDHLSMLNFRNMRERSEERQSKDNTNRYKYQR